MSKSFFLAAACGAALAFTHIASAQTILFQDDFSGSGGLNGTSPDITQPGVTWTAAVGYNANGTYATSAQSDTAYLSYTFQTGNIYTFTADLNTTGSSLIMFIGSSDTNLFGMNNSVGFRLDDSADPNAQLHTFPNGAGVANWDPPRGTVENGQTAQIVLNTTAAQWTVSFTYDGTSYGTFNYTPAVGPTVIGFGAGLFGGGTGSIDNMTLSVVPEPSSLGLLGALGGVLVLSRRRKVAGAMMAL
jgi:hypothetical protein